MLCMDAENSLPHDLGSGGRPCRFESCYPQPKGLSQNAAYTRYVAATDRVRTPYPVYSGYFATAPFTSVLHFLLHSPEKQPFPFISWSSSPQRLWPLGGPPLVDSFANIFYIFQKYSP